jgi:hypothetical protein
LEQCVCRRRKFEGGLRFPNAGIFRLDSGKTCRMDILVTISPFLLGGELAV